jgi:MFS family permease
MQIPSNLVLSKIRWPAVWICSAVIGWGLLCCRFFLGVIEAVFFPGAFFYLSMFYNRKQSKLDRFSGYPKHY